MKRKFKTPQMQAIIACLLLCTVIFCGACSQREYTENKPKQLLDDCTYQTIVIDSCEYIIGEDYHPYNGGYFLTHKGNCKFCRERSKK